MPVRQPCRCRVKRGTVLGTLAKPSVSPRRLCCLSRQQAPAAWRCSPQIHRDQVRRFFDFCQRSVMRPSILSHLFSCREVPNLKGSPSGGLLFIRPNQDLSNRSGSIAIFTAIRRASSFVSSVAVDRRPDSSSKMFKDGEPVLVAHDGLVLFEAALVALA